MCKNKKVSAKKNHLSTGLIVIAFLLYMLGFAVCLCFMYLETKCADSDNAVFLFAMGIAVLIFTFVGGTVLIGFAKIIMLLCSVENIIGANKTNGHTKP